MTTNDDADSAAGWTSYCSQCGHAIWAIWLPSQHRTRRMDYSNREREHVCTFEKGRP